MAGFTYNGNSTETIIETPLILVSSETPGSVVGAQRSKIEGDITISRPIANEYGVTGEPLSFTYSLMKSDYETFTEEEQIAVERWLTSPKLSSELVISDCDDNSYSYFGLFISTEWIIGNGGFMMCTFTFQVNGMYAIKHYTELGSAATYENGEITAIADQFNMDFTCYSDELDEFIYPIIKITGVNRSVTSSFKIKNISDSNNEIEVTVSTPETIIIDCNHCIIKRQTANGEYKLLKYSEIGWNRLGGAGKIYWPRLVVGENHLLITGNVNVEISYDSPFKKVGGWLI